MAEIRPDLRTVPFYTYTDHLGTPYMQTDTVGNILWWAEYEPYGNVWTMRVPPYAPQLLRFPGQEAETTWEGAEERYNIFRWYRSGWGRYTQADPIGIDGGLNVFLYAGGRPVDSIDLQGLAYRTCRLNPPKSSKYPRLPAGDEPILTDYIDIVPKMEIWSELFKELIPGPDRVLATVKRRCTWRCYCESWNRTCEKIPCKRAQKGLCRLDHGVVVVEEYADFQFGVAPCSTLRL